MIKEGVMPINLDSVFEKLGQATKTAGDNLEEDIKDLDPSDTPAVMAMTYKMQKWTIATNLESNTIKTIGDSIKSMVQNIR
jgi:type III secretion apparatus needle protein